MKSSQKTCWKPIKKQWLTTDIRNIKKSIDIQLMPCYTMVTDYGKERSVSRLHTSPYMTESSLYVAHIRMDKQSHAYEKRTNQYP